MEEIKTLTRNEERVEKITMLLSLPHQSRYNALPNVERPAGLPINALPGWESIPLHSKLPMLKCPDNQVIFTKNKIGRTYESWQRDFDSVCQNSKMDYNPLHDPHLRRFYSNEKLLKRLRDNGEITENNDVICTLKEFNEHRIPLHDAYLSLIRIERNRLEDEKRDQQMVAHAEKIAELEQKLSERGTKATTRGQVKECKEQLGKHRAQWIQAIILRSQKKAQLIETMKQDRQAKLVYRKEVQVLRQQHRLNVGLDIQRKRLIALKKRLQFKSDRLKNAMKTIKGAGLQMAKEKARNSWEKHLLARKAKHEQVKELTKENERVMKEWIANHMAEYKHKWEEIQAQLEIRAYRSTKKLKRARRRRKHLKIQDSLEKIEEKVDYLQNLTEHDFERAIQTAIDLESSNAQKITTEGCIYRAAKYILNDILAKFDKDLSGVKHIEAVLECRICGIFSEVKHYVIQRAAQIITTIGLNKYCTLIQTPTQSHIQLMLSKLVKFSSFPALIGKGFYANEGDRKKTTGRLPTPVGSLTSVVIEPDTDSDETLRKPRLGLHRLALTRDEQIFVEHLVIKFKRQLTVGIGRQVLGAIECHRNNKILDVRKELQDIDRKFLAKVMARSILSYAINPCNFHANSRLCQQALAAEIISTLQNTILKPERDPRRIVQPRSRCTCKCPIPFGTRCR